MEKIKPILAAIKQHHFWILAGLGVIAVLYCWNAAVGQIEEEFNKNKGAVGRQFSKLGQLGNQPKYQNGFPNEQWAEKTKEVTGKVNLQAQHAWQRVVQLQKPTLKWPEDLGPEFGAAVDEHKQAWADDMIQAYAEVAPSEVRRLRTLMGAAADADSAGVVWKPEDYDLLVEAFAPEKIKNTAGCKIRQNALWVYQSLAEAIAATNADAPDRFNLPIHTVVELAVDKKANLKNADWAVIGFTESGPPPAPPAEDPDAPEGAEAPPPPAPTLIPSLLANISQAPKVPGYNLRPFRLRVRMNLDHLPKLLAACANSKVPLDIRGMRFEHPARLTVVQTEEPKPTRRPLGGRGLWGRPRPAPAAKKELPKPETAPTKIERGTLVEIWGYGYFTRDDEIVAPGTASRNPLQGVERQTASLRPSATRPIGSPARI